MGSNPGWTSNQGLKKTSEIMLAFFILLSLLKIKGDVKEPTLLFEKSSGSFPGDVVNLSRITHHSYHGP